MNNIKLIPLQDSDREQFISDNQEAFNYGALEEFGRRDDHFEENEQIISRETIERSIDNGEAYCIMLDNRPVGGVIISVDGEKGDLDILFTSPKDHSKGVGYAAWCEVEKIHTEKAPAAVGPYSQAIVTGGMVYTSGQIALDPKSGELVGKTIEEQAEQVMKNLVAILEKAGTKPENAVKTLWKVKDADFLLFYLGWDERWGTKEYFGDYPCIDDSVLDHILDGNYKGVGFDVIGLDPIADENLTRHKKLFKSKDIVNIENLCNLGKCGSELFGFSCFPLKIKDCDGSPIRAVAWFE